MFTVWELFWIFFSSSLIVLRCPRGYLSVFCRWSNVFDNVCKTNVVYTAIHYVIQVSALSLSAGVGGGGILTPIFNVILGLKIKNATALSQVAIATSGLGSAVFNLATSHPENPRKSLADLVIASKMAPSLLLGVSFGVLFNLIAPGWLVVSLLFVLLTVMSVRTFMTAMRIYHKEREVADGNVDMVEVEDDLEGLQCPLVNMSISNNDFCCIETDSLEEKSNPASDDDRSLTSSEIGGSSKYQERAKELNRPIVPKKHLMRLFGTWIVFTGLGLLQDAYNRCSIPFFLLYAAQIGLAICLTIVFNDEANIDCYDKNDMTSRNNDMSSKKMGLVISLGSVLAGFVGATLGLGGGILISPLLLELGMHPQSSSATSAILVLFASSSASVYFGAAGNIKLNSAVIFGISCGLSAFLGVSILSKIVKKNGSNIVVFILSGMMAIGAVATAIGDGRRIFKEVLEGNLPGFHSFCQNN